MVGLIISVHFQQFENLKFLIFSGRACPRISQKPKQSSQPSRIRQFTWESRIPTWLQSEHEYPDFEEQLSQANEQRHIFVKLS